ncbi:carnitine O-acetyltransferase-like isoform X2 [Antedon mediterranea]
MSNTMKQAIKPTACLMPLKAKTGRMFIHQRHLPKLPVPPLQQTLYRYLLSVKPLLSDFDFDTTKKLVDDFGRPGGIGEKLQMGLIERSKKLDNWLSQWWLDHAYLNFREPVIIHSSPAVIFPQQSYTDLDGQLKFAASVVAGILDFKVMVDNQSLPVDKLGGSPLCMYQYYKILSSCRIPGSRKDSIVTHPADGPDPPKHIVVAHNYKFFSLEVYKDGWTPLTRSEIYQQLCDIVNRSQETSAPVGILTAENRNTWGKIYNQMNKDRTNRAIFSEIQRSIFVLCLDEKISSLPKEEFDNEVGRQLLHGGGSELNSGNRWADKTLQFIVGPNGACGLQYEHAPAEGPPIATLLDHTLTYCDNVCEDVAPVDNQLTPAKRLKFNLIPDVKEAIENAKISIDSMIEDLELQIFKFKLFGKDFVKANKLSPDGFIQVALQLAYFKIYGESCATYESASLRRYQLGRTDTIRSCSTDSDLFLRAMADSDKSNSELVRLMRQAVESHKEYTNMAVFGDGIDRHLLGLKLMAIEWGWNVPDLMMDTAYNISTHFKLSTSQVPAKTDSTLTFGPVVPDGFGVCYNPKSKHINFAVSAFNSSPSTSSMTLSLKLTESLAEMQNILVQGSMSAKL